MGLRFLGIDPNTGNDESPTVWQDEKTGDLIIQGYTADEETLRQIDKAGSAPGHSTAVPPHESVIRLPARMIKFIPAPEGDIGRAPSGP